MNKAPDPGPCVIQRPVGGRNALPRRVAIAGPGRLRTPALSRCISCPLLRNLLRNLLRKFSRTRPRRPTEITISRPSMASRRCASAAAQRRVGFGDFCGNDDSTSDSFCEIGIRGCRASAALIAARLDGGGATILGPPDLAIPRPEPVCVRRRVPHEGQALPETSALARSAPMARQVPGEHVGRRAPGGTCPRAGDARKEKAPPWRGLVSRAGGPCGWAFNRPGRAAPGSPGSPASRCPG